MRGMLGYCLQGCYSMGMKLERIVTDPAICLGKPTIRGTRITVDFVLRLIGDGLTTPDIVRDYPELTVADIQQAAKYAAWLASEQTASVA
jgi:uncharacterized protein (DUF433 family)